MLDCERLTLTHSSGWAAVLVGLGLELALALGLAAMKASSDAEAVAEADVWDDDGEAEPGWDGEPVPAGDPVPEGELDAEGEPEGDALLALEPDAGALAGAEGEDGEGDWGCGVSVGVGVGVLVAGSTSHLVSVFASALVEVLALGEAVPSFTVPARATPAQPASMPRVRKTPVSRLRTAARTCASRMKIALLVAVTVYSLWDSEATR